MTTKKTTRKRSTTKQAAAKRTTATKRKTKAKMSALDAAARVLAESSEPLNTREMLEQMATQKLWKSPSGKTPANTLHSAIMREINVKGKDSRFKKVDRGRFAVKP